MRPRLSNSRYGPGGQTCFHLGVVVVLVMSLTHNSLACFPVGDVFKASCMWVQSTSMQSRNRIFICPERRGADAPMKIETEGLAPRLEPPKTLLCLRHYGDYRYKVKVTATTTGAVLGYQCLKFYPLSDRVVRQEKTSIVADEKQLDCDSAVYTLDEAVLIGSYLDPVPQPCPLTGGFQLLVNLGESPSKEDCLGSMSSYLPQLLFECDEAGSSRAIIDLGKLCTPKVLWTSQSLRGRYVAHLQCLASWQENRGSSLQEFTTVLLGMRDSYLSFWCLHFQRLAGKAGDILYKAVLTLDGRCLPDLTAHWDTPKNTDLVGKLVSFKPGNATECKDKSYLSTCDEDGGAASCRESLRCPANCGRCKKNLKLRECAFPEAMRGSWGSFSYDEKPSIAISMTKVQSQQFGRFQCRSPVEVGEARGMYAMVQAGAEPTCWPYYSCAQLRSLAPGLLSFQMRPALRDIYTGRVQSCQETYQQVWSIRPEKAEETKTLLDRNKLKPTPCEFVEPKAFPTLGLVKGCQIIIPQCYGSCNAFNISLDARTCDNMTTDSTGIYTQHVCMAKIDFDNGAHAVLTKILDTQEDREEYRCWLFTRSRLYLLRADYCNQNQIDSVFKFGDRPEFTYDPFYQLVMTKSQSSGRGNKMTEPNLITIGLVLSSWLVLFRAGTQSTK